MITYKKLFLGLLLSQTVGLSAYYPNVRSLTPSAPMEVNLTTMGILAVIGGAQYFRASPPEKTAAETEHKIYRNGRILVGVGSAALLSIIPDHRTRSIVAASGVAIGELARVIKSNNAQEEIRYLPALQYAGILAGASLLLNAAKNAIIVRL
jgi:hypothetical protein